MGSVNDSLPLYNRLLINSPGFYRQFKCGDLSVWAYDQSSIPFLIEEFVACAAIQIAVPARSLATAGLGELPSLLRDRVRVVDEDRTIERDVDSMLAPLFDELGPDARSDDWQMAVDDDGQLEESQVISALAALRQEFYEFLLGGRLRLQVGVRLDRVKNAIDFLRERTRSPNARACLAILAGAIATYQPLAVPSVSMVPAAAQEQILRFHAFVEDESYRQLSEHARYLGIPAVCRHGAQLMRRQLHRLVNSPVGSAILKTGSKAVTAVTKAPTVDSELLQTLLGGPYFPPIVSLAGAYARARKHWGKTVRTMDELFESRRRFGYTEFFAQTERDFGEPWVEVRDGAQPARHVSGAAWLVSGNPKSWQHDLFGPSGQIEITRTAKPSGRKRR